MVLLIPLSKGQDHHDEGIMDWIDKLSIGAKATIALITTGMSPDQDIIERRHDNRGGVAKANEGFL